MPAGFASPDVLFGGNSGAPERLFYRVILEGLRKRYSRYAEVGVGSFAASMVAADAGWKPGQMESSDVTLYSSIVGTALSGGDLASLGVCLDGDLVELPDTDPLTQAAFLLWVQLRARMEARPDVEYWRNICHDLTVRARAHQDAIRGQLAKLADRLNGIKYRPWDMWDHIPTVLEDPNAIVLAAPPSYACLAPGHRLLTADLRWVPAGEIREGDRLLAFEAESGPSGRRRLETATVLRSVPARRECVRVVLEDGAEFICTTDHPWMTMRHREWSERHAWTRADQLMSAVRRSKNHAAPGLFVLKAFDVWDSPRTWEAGWLAGMYDGEGTFSSRGEGKRGARDGCVKLSISQSIGPVQERIEAVHRDLGFKVASHPTKGGNRPVVGIELLGGYAEIARLLGTVRPQRLLDKFSVEHRRLSTIARTQVVAVEPVGEQAIQSITTSTGTYIGEGYLMHNTGFETFFNTNDRLTWDEPSYDVFDPATGFDRLADMMRDSPALLICLQECQPKTYSLPRPVFATPIGMGRHTYVITNRPDEIFAITGGPHVVPRRMGEITPSTHPPMPPDYDLKPDAKIDMLPVKAQVADYYRDIWLHRLAATPGAYNVLVTVDGYVACVIGYSIETMSRPYPGATHLRHLLLRYGVGAPHVQLRTGRLATMFALQKPAAELAVGIGGQVYLAASQGLITVQMTRYPESKEMRGLMKRVNKQAHPDGFKLTYAADWRDQKPNDVLAEFLTIEAKWRTQRAKAKAAETTGEE